MRNRIKELREAAGLSLEELAARVGGGVASSTVHKLESGTMRLTLEWMQRLGPALGIDPIMIVDDRVPAASGMAEDVRPWEPAQTSGKSEPPPRRGHARYIVTSPALDEVGLLPGDIVDVDETEDARRALATGDVVVAEAEIGPAGTTTVVMREFIEPALLITNARTDNALPINMRTTRTTIVGVVVRVHRDMPRKR